MKSLTCDLCDHVAEAETFEQWMEMLKPHYMQAHADIMASKMGTPEQMKEAMMKWMADNRARFDAA